MTPSDRKIQFILENVKEEENENENQIQQNGKKRGIMKRPPFQKSRLESPNNQQNEPSSIKEQHRPDLKRLSLPELKIKLIEQERIVRNRKLLEKLKDKGEKAKKFLIDIQEEIVIREKNVNKNTIKTEQLLEELSIKEEVKEEEDEMKIIEQKSPYKDAYSKNRARLLDQNHPNKRFNQPAAKPAETFIDLQRTVKTLSYQESLEHLEKATKKEKDSMREQMIRFYNYRTRDDDDDDDYESDFDNDNDNNYDDDVQDANVIRVNFRDFSG